MSQSAIIAIGIVSIEFLILAGILFYLYKRTRDIIGENVLRNSTYTLLEHNYWRDKREIKNLKAQLEEAIADSLGAHEAMDKMNKIIQNGSRDS